MSFNLAVILSETARSSPGRPEHVGEVVTRGLHVMKGYLNQPEATSEEEHQP